MLNSNQPTNRLKQQRVNSYCKQWHSCSFEKFRIVFKSAVRSWVSFVSVCSSCFDTVGWTSERASSL